ncbi:MAG: monooxygenase [Chloroflexi bacterium]|nr:monooxygenase [Chloroflexota bacterium]
MLIRIEGTDLPGRACGPAPDFSEGYHNIHVAVQGRGRQDLLGLMPADVPSACWELACQVVSVPPAADLRGRQIQGSPGKRFIYVTWGVVDAAGSFRMFRRAKLWLDAVPDEVMRAAIDGDRLVGRLGLSDAAGWPLCAAVRPPRIAWSAS